MPNVLNVPNCSPYENSPISVLVANYPAHANMFPKRRITLIRQDTKFGDIKALPHYFEIYKITILSNGNTFFIGCHNHLAPVQSQDVHKVESFEYFVDAQKWIEYEKFALK